MKLIYFVCAFVLSNNTLLSNPLLVITLMVKNEESAIQATLQPFVDAGIDAYYIFDTGSTDNTLEVARDYLHQNNIQNFFITQEPFIDFSISRNRALELTEMAFPEAIFILMPDAEWYMHNVEGLTAFCKEHVYDANPSYLIRIMNDQYDFYTGRLIRSHSNAYFSCSVHEVIMPPSYKTVDKEVFFEWRPSAIGHKKSRDRWKRDIEWLLKEHDVNPQDGRIVYCIAQTYLGLGDIEAAIEWFEKRLIIPGALEEIFLAHYRLGGLYYSNDESKKAITHYLLCILIAPWRAEPWVKLSCYFWDIGDYKECYTCALQATQVPYPYNDLLFVEKELYDYTRYAILGCAAWYVGEYEIGKQATLKALEIRPHESSLAENLRFYNEHKN